MLPLVGGSFMDDQGTKRVKRMTLYSAITSQLIWQKKCGSANAETDVYLYRWSTVLNRTKIIKNKDVNNLGTNTLYTILY